MEVNSVAILAWTAALRSGTYTQGPDRLYDGTNHDVLGVAVEVFAIENVVPLTWVNRVGLPPTIFYPDLDGNINENGEVLPEMVTRWLFAASLNDPEVLRSRVPQATLDTWVSLTHSRYSDYISLTALNDIGGSSFSELADIIEAEFLQL